jgi:hypothetical protein
MNDGSGGVAGINCLEKGKSQSGEDHSKKKQTYENMKSSNRKEKKNYKVKRSVGTAVNETVRFCCFSLMLVFI